jgi:hypothetical protein
VVTRVDATILEAARTRSGADAWDAAVRQGSLLSFGDAIAYALDEPNPPGRQPRHAAVHGSPSGLLRTRGPAHVVEPAHRTTSDPSLDLRASTPLTCKEARLNRTLRN